MSIIDSLKTVLTLSTKLKILYHQFTHLKVTLVTLDSIDISSNAQKVPLGKSLIATNLELMFLISESILEEYNNILTPAQFPEFKYQILSFKKDIKPAMKRFNRWNDRRKYRNVLVAHNLRLKDRSSIFASQEKITFNAPYHDNDFVIIYYLHEFMCHCLNKHFTTELQSIDGKLVIDQIEFSSERRSLKEELPIIEGWAKDLGFEIFDLQAHIKHLFRRNEP
jgi:hypothetical protein